MQFQKQSKKYIIPLASIEWRDHNSFKMTPSVWLDLILENCSEFFASEQKSMILRNKRNKTLRGGEWFFKDSGSGKILVEFHGSRSLVFWAVMCVLQSRFLYEGVSESQFFAMLKGLEVPIRWFVFFWNDVFSSLDIEFQ